MGLITVAILDDQTLLRKGLCRIIGQESDIQVAGEASSCEEMLVAMAGKRPDVALVDPHVPDGDGFRLVASIRQCSPGSKVIVLSERCSEDEALRALKAGARGYLPKHVNGATLIKCLRVVHAGQIWAESHITARLLDEYSSLVRSNEHATLSNEKHLTEREFEVLRLIAQGYSNRDMAHRLYISEKTVKTHLSNIFEKIQVADRLQAALYAIRNRIVEF